MQREITIRKGADEIDIRVDEKQRIMTSLKILSENKPEYKGINKASDIRVKRTGRQIDKSKTYEEAGIYSGEIIVLG